MKERLRFLSQAALLPQSGNPRLLARISSPPTASAFAPALLPQSGNPRFSLEFHPPRISLRTKRSASPTFPPSSVGNDPQGGRFPPTLKARYPSLSTLYELREAGFFESSSIDRECPPTRFANSVKASKFSLLQILLICWFTVSAYDAPTGTNTGYLASTSTIPWRRMRFCSSSSLRAKAISFTKETNL